MHSHTIGNQDLEFQLHVDTYKTHIFLESFVSLDTSQANCRSATCELGRASLKGGREGGREGGRTYY